MNEAAPVTREARRKNRYQEGRPWGCPASGDDFSAAIRSSGVSLPPEYASLAAAVLAFPFDRLRPVPCAAIAVAPAVLPGLSDLFSRNRTATARAMLMRPATAMVPGRPTSRMSAKPLARTPVAAPMLLVK